MLYCHFYPLSPSFNIIFLRAGLSILPTLKGPVAEGEYTLGAMGVMAYDWLDEKGQKLKTMLFSILRHHPSCAKVFLPFK